MATDRDPYDPTKTGVPPVGMVGTEPYYRRRSTWGWGGAALVILLVLLLLWLFWPRAGFTPTTGEVTPPPAGAPAPTPAPATPPATAPAPTR